MTYPSIPSYPSCICSICLVKKESIDIDGVTIFKPPTPKVRRATVNSTTFFTIVNILRRELFAIVTSHRVSFERVYVCKLIQLQLIICKKKKKARASLSVSKQSRADTPQGQNVGWRQTVLGNEK